MLPRVTPNITLPHGEPVIIHPPDRQPTNL
jgi:hypothetical protein